MINPEEKTNILSARLLELNTRIHQGAGQPGGQGSGLQRGAEPARSKRRRHPRQGEALKKLTESLNQEQQKFAEMKKTFGVNHPEYPEAAGAMDEIQPQIAATRASIVQRVEAEYHEAANRETMLEQSGNGNQDRVRQSQRALLQYQSLKREAESDKKLYEELVRKIKEAGINAGFQNSSIRIADEARPGLKPVFPRTWLNVLLAFLFASFIGVGAAVLGDVLDNTIRDPDQVRG